jgi:hypothetical protein
MYIDSNKFTGDVLLLVINVRSVMSPYDGFYSAMGDLWQGFHVVITLRTAWYRCDQVYLGDLALPLNSGDVVEQDLNFLTSVGINSIVL